MGASVTVREPYEYSISADAEDNAQPNKNILQVWKLRRRSLSTESPTKFLPVRIDYLDVPYFDRHPFQDFRFGKKLGEGSFSVVYKGFIQAEETSCVAIKEITMSSLSKQQVVNLNNEMNILSQLKHESIVQLKSVYASGEKRFLIMEYLRGGQLLNAICKREYYRESDARRVMYQITMALHYMHERMVIHRDIKPENIILADRSLESPVKLVDFGFAVVESETTRQPSKQLVGSPGYFAPEVLRERSYSTKCDIWSLGVVFYIILSGLMPFSTEQSDESNILTGNYYFPSSRFNAVSESAKDLIRKMLVVNPEKRYSARDVLNHPWMKLSIPMSESRTQIMDENLVDADISENLEYIRQHHATKKFNLAAMVLATISPIRRSVSGGTPPPSGVLTSDKPIFPSEDLSNNAMQEKLTRLSSAIGHHNAALA